MLSQTTWPQWITLIIVIISWIAIPWITEYRRKQAEVGIWQHTAMSDAHRNLAKSLYEFEQCLNELISKHNCDASDLPSKMTDKEFNEANRFVQQMNAELAMMYMIMPDNKYKVIQDAIGLEQKTTLRYQRENLLVAMRKSQFPDTAFGELKNIRFFYVLKKPDKETEK